ncbi:histidine phosphatase family protein [Patescibacteria group bacterium]
MKTKIYLVRHGEVENPKDTHYGRMPGFSLSNKGLIQAKETGKFLEQFSIEKIYSSPLERAAETASEISKNLSIKVELVDQLLEVHSKWDGTPRVEMAKRDWNLFEHPDGALETIEDFFERVYGFFLLINEKHVGEEIVVVAHGDSVMIPKARSKGVSFENIHTSDVYAEYVSYAEVHEVLMGKDDFSMKSIFIPKQ